MIFLNVLPCEDCVFYAGIKQPMKKEENEYVACDEAKNGNATELLYIKNKKYFCPKYKSGEPGRIY